MFSEFSGRLAGFFAFLIFGTTQDAFETLRGGCLLLEGIVERVIVVGRSIGVAEVVGRGMDRMWVIPSTTTTTRVMRTLVKTQLKAMIVMTTSTTESTTCVII